MSEFGELVVLRGDVWMVDVANGTVIADGPLTPGDLEAIRKIFEAESEGSR